MGTGFIGQLCDCAHTCLIPLGIKKQTKVVYVSACCCAVQVAVLCDQPALGMFTGIVVLVSFPTPQLPCSTGKCPVWTQLYWHGNASASVACVVLRTNKKTLFTFSGVTPSASRLLMPA